MAPKQRKRKPEAENKDFKKDVKVTKVSDHWTSLQEWKDVSRYQTELSECGFGDLLLGHGMVPKHDLHLIEALITFYDPESWCFKFNNEVTIHYGLLDILFITGLNIDGKAVTGYESDDMISKMFEGFVGISKDESRSWFEKDWMKLSSFPKLNKDTRSDEECLKLFCLFAIGAVICPASSQGVSKIYIPLLSDVKKIKEFAWGAAMLAAFHYSIRLVLSHCENRVSADGQVHGPWLPFIVFLCEMIPDFATGLMGAEKSFRPTEVPIMKQWAQELDRSSRNTYHGRTKESYVEFFSNLNIDQVKLHRYENRGLTAISERMRRQIPVAAAIVPVINFNMEGRNFPHVNPERFDISKQEVEDFVETIEFVPPIPMKRRGGRKPKEGRYWDKYFSEAKAQWDKRTKFIMPLAATACSPVGPSRMAMDQRSSTTDSVVSKSTTKKLLVLDINGILGDVVYIDNKKSGEIISNSWRDENRIFHPITPLDRAIKVCGSHWVFKRPHCDDFILFCLERFEVAVWSSKERTNVEKLVIHLFKELRSRLLFVWDKEHCDKVQREEKGKKKDVFVKPLSKVWEWNNKYNKENTLLIDDSVEKTLVNPEGNVLCPPSYYYNRKVDDESLAPRGELQIYLDGLANAGESVPEYLKNTPFVPTRHSYKLPRLNIHKTN